MLQECVSKCGDAKVFLKIVFETSILVACNMQQNQTDFFCCMVHATNIDVKNLAKQN